MAAQCPARGIDRGALALGRRQREPGRSGFDRGPFADLDNILAEVPQRLVDSAALRRILGFAQSLVAGADVDAHGRGLDARLLHHVERLPSIDRAQLLAITDRGEAVELEQVREADQLFLVAIADHRGFIEQNHSAAQFLPCFGERSLVAAIQQRGMALQEPRHGHRRYPGFALEHLHKRILDRESEHLLASFA